jgi:cell wall-associated NlpC family hydrolase
MIGPVYFSVCAAVVGLRIDNDEDSNPYHPGGCGLLAHSVNLAGRELMKGRYLSVVCATLAALLLSTLPAYSQIITLPPESPVKIKRTMRSPQKPPELNLAGRYVTRPGDSLYRIARAFKTTPEALMSDNKLRSAKIKIGQELTVPGAQAAAGLETPKTAAASPPPTVSPNYPAISQPGSPGQVPDENSPPRRLQLVKAGFEMLGVRYRYSGISEKNGFDCSGLVKSLFSKFDIELPRSSREQFKQGERVDRDELEVGDLVFFSSGGKQPTHVGIYVGNDKFLHAARKARQVIVSDLNKIWYTMRYLGARRITDLWGDGTADEASEY